MTVSEGPRSGKRHPLNMRTTAETWQKMEAAAKASGRSLAQEVEHRLEMSFRDYKASVRPTEANDEVLEFAGLDEIEKAIEAAEKVSMRIYMDMCLAQAEVDRLRGAWTYSAQRSRRLLSVLEAAAAGEITLGGKPNVIP